MSLTTNTNYLINLPKLELSQLLKELFVDRIGFELLNPTTLGSEWKQVVFLENDKNLLTEQNQKLATLGRVLDVYSPFKGLKKNFVDNRIDGSVEDIEKANQNQETLLMIAGLLENLATSKDDSSEKLEIEKELNELKIDPKNLSSRLYRDLSLLHAGLELDQKINQLEEVMFTTPESSEHKTTHSFGLFSVVAGKGNKNRKRFVNFLKKHNLAGQEVGWVDDLVDWKNSYALTPFQGVAQSLGTIDKKEVDPSSVVAVFFSLFFAFCLADAIYGAIVAIFTGYFLFFTKIKPNFKPFFTLFYYCGLASILFGILTNSWAGDIFLSRLFATTPVKGFGDFLINFQLIDILNPLADVPINNYLRENGNINPVIAMLGFSVATGFIAIITAFILNILNFLKEKNIKEVINQSVYIGFIFSIIFYILAGSTGGILASIAPTLLGVGLIALFVFNNGKGILSKIGAGLFGKTGLYSLVEFSSNLMSFTRLVSTGLTGAIVASVINLLAYLLFQAGGPIFGIPLAILMLVIGHTFNLVISLFSSYINPLRLHYVEFMNKFYRGSATQTRPIETELSYLNLK